MQAPVGNCTGPTGCKSSWGQAHAVHAILVRAQECKAITACPLQHHHSSVHTCQGSSSCSSLSAHQHNTCQQQL
eukprot:scaffold90443_cov20-Tisochrysis_lutea.AAC.5